ncbi:transcription termination/antitermination protein NusA [Candidatus Daviesbacteria bacterium]|nr:transcription termination/antitermination protein NusA [Candidatus Daviesbacteria bacterium]
MAQARTEFAAALNQIASEKGVDVGVVLDAIKVAALAAYKKDLMLRNESVPDNFEEFTSKVDPVTGEISILDGDKNMTPPGFARIAASIAKQVIMQRLNEAERGTILAEYESKVGTVISGSIQRQEGNTFFVDLGRAEGVLPPSEQVRSEMYHQNQRLKFLVKEIREGGRGSEVVVSRSDPNLVKALFALEVPEIQSGAVEIKVIAREAGSRTKVAAISTEDGVDPVGSLVGQKGVRVQAVIGELGEEKIDIISFSDDPARFIAQSLSPAKDIQVRLNEKDKIATVTVPQSQLSLAIGKGGQNVRLAAKITGWKIDIVGAEEPEIQDSVIPGSEATSESKKDSGQVRSPQSEPRMTKVLPPEETSAEEEKAEATDPSKTPGEAVAEAVEENITQAEQDKSIGGELEEEEDQPVNAQAVADAEADIEEEDAKSGETEKEKIAEEKGSMEEVEARGDIIGDREPTNEETAPAEDIETKEAESKK